MKSWHSLNHSEYGICISYNEYCVSETVVTSDQVTADATTSNSYTNACAIVQELESFSSKI